MQEQLSPPWLVTLAGILFALPVALLWWLARPAGSEDFGITDDHGGRRDPDDRHR